VGALFSFTIGQLYEKYRFRQELKNNNDINVSGDDWHAAWQTSVDGIELLNTEHLVMRQRGATIRMWNKEKSPENPKGGYLWTAQLRFLHGRDLMGWYFPRPKENNASKGIMFMHYDSSKKVFWGKWVGAAYDGPLSNGFVVVTKERSKSLDILKDVLKKHPSGVPIISNNI
jgi:hypothetical protein